MPPRKRASAEPAPAPRVASGGIEARRRFRALMTQSDWTFALIVLSQTEQLEPILDADFSIAQLREIGRNRGIVMSGPSKAAMAQQLARGLATASAEALRDPERYLDGLRPVEADFVRRALTAYGLVLPLPRSAIERLWQATPGRDVTVSELQQALHRQALLFPARIPDFGGLRDIFYGWRQLGVAGLEPVLRWDFPARTPRGAGRGNARVFLADFEQVIAAVQATPLRRRARRAPHRDAASQPFLRNHEHDAADAEAVLGTRSGWAPDPRTGIQVVPDDVIDAPTAARLSAQTGLSERHALVLATLAAGQCLLTDPVPSKPGAPLSVRMDALELWLSLSNEEKLLEAWHCWTRTLAFGLEASLAGVPVYRAVGVSDLSPSLIGTAWCEMRQYFVRILRGLPVDAWVAWPALREAMRQLHPHSANTIAQRHMLWFGKSANRQPPPDNEANWNATEGAIFAAMACEVLTAFGALDVVVEEGALTALRVTSTGHWLFERLGERGIALPAEARPAERPREPVRWLDDNTCRLPPAPDRGDYMAFARVFGEPGRAPFTYHITAASMERALRNGITPVQAAEHFEALGAPLPASIRTRFEAMAGRFGRVRAYESVCALTLGDDVALRELLAATSLRDAVVHTLSPRVVIVRADRVDALMKEMVEKGFMPGVRG